MNNNEILNQIRIPTPCPVSWSTMSGDDKVRFCGKCQLNVYNISNMSSNEAIELIKEKEGKLCVQLFRRQDGTVLTDNCPIALRKIRDRARRCAAVAVSMAFWLGLLQQGANAEKVSGAVFRDPATGQLRTNSGPITSLAQTKALNGGTTATYIVKDFDGKTKTVRTGSSATAVITDFPDPPPSLQGAINGAIDTSIYDATQTTINAEATNGTIGGEMSLSLLETIELEKQRQKVAAQKTGLLLSVPAAIGVSILWFMRRKHNSSIVRMAIICASIVGLLGIVWGYIAGV